MISQVVKMDERYQVKIPPQARRALRLHRGENLRLEIVGDKIVLSVAGRHTARFLGAGRGLWGDVEAYIEKERSTWEK
jgi:bifunctional DNA-binding transcriptional regulator/antitoxin component of YhaV-PrlF toxin-antitoxin module